MFEGIQRYFQNIRYGSITRRKKWLVWISVISVVGIVFLWLLLFSTRPIGVLDGGGLFEKTETGEMLKAAGDLFENTKQTFTEGIEALQGASSTEY